MIAEKIHKKDAVHIENPNRKVPGQWDIVKFNGVRYMYLSNKGGTIVRDCNQPAYGSTEIMEDTSEKENKERKKKWQTNIYHNMQWIQNNKWPTTCRLSYPNIPAYIVGNGPSLEKNYQELERVTNGIILAENGSTRFVKNPTFFLTMDYEGRDAWYNNEDGTPIDFSQTVAILHMVCSSKVPKSRFKDIIWYCGTDPTPYMKNVRIKYPEMPRLDPLWHINYDALQIAMLMGCNPIVFVGQDYALTNNQEHAGSAEQRHERKKKWPDIYGKETTTSDIYAKCCAAVMASCFFASQTRTIINATEGGILSDMFFKAIMEKNDQSIALEGAMLPPKINQIPLAKVVDKLNSLNAGAK